MMVLIFLADALKTSVVSICPSRCQWPYSNTYWDISHNRDAHFLQNVGVAHARPLEDLWASKGTCGDNNELVRFDCLVDRLRKRELRLVIGIWLVLDSNGTRWC